jgi:hypothetical protein
MSLDIGDYVFEGPYSTPVSLEEEAGIFVVFCRTGEDCKGLDCGIAGQAKTAVLGHSRRGEWEDICASVSSSPVAMPRSSTPSPSSRLNSE